MHSQIIFLAVLSIVVNAATIPFHRIRIPASPAVDDAISLDRRDPRVTATIFTTIFVPLPSTEPTTVSSATSETATPTSILSPPSPTSSSNTIYTSSLSSEPTPTSTATSASIPPTTSTSTPSTGTSPKYVVAHVIVGNTYPYSIQDWVDDITLAHASGIDGFALNTGREDWEPARIADAYTAAQQTNLGFKLFLSLDMSSLPCGSPTDAQNLRNMVNAHASHPNQFMYQSRAFVSTFAGESCQFEQGSAAVGWKTQFTQHPDLHNKIYFVPSFFIDPATFKDFSGVMDGDFSWNSGWPIQVTTSFADKAVSALDSNTPAPLANSQSRIATSPAAAAVNNAVSSILGKVQLALTKFIGSTSDDDAHVSGLAGLSNSITARDGSSSKPAYMGAVSPGFFTHFDKNSFDKNFIYLSDQHLYARRWEAMIGSRSQYDIAQILTWNDYGESHYIGPIKGAQPNDSKAWTDGMNHTAWLGLTKYYATAFKTGQYPVVEKDEIVMWSRPHSKDAQSPDPVPKPTNFELFDDIVWAVVLTTAPSTVILSTSSNAADTKTYEVPAGLSKLAVPISPGGTMKGVIQRGGQTILTLNPSDFLFQPNPKTYNFNAYVARAVAE